jgi:hypothetical protein
LDLSGLKLFDSPFDFLRPRSLDTRNRRLVQTFEKQAGKRCPVCLVEV